MDDGEEKMIDPFLSMTERIAVSPIETIKLSNLRAYEKHPFKVRNDSELDNLAQDIQTNGLLNPIIVRRFPWLEYYDILSGHRRVEAMKLLGRDEIAARVVFVTDSLAAHIVIYSNIMHRKVLPSEKGKALALRNEYIKDDGHHIKDEGKRNKWAQEIMAQEFNESKSSIFRYIRLNYLIPSIVNLVDNNKLALVTAVDLSYFTKEQQEVIFEYFFRYKRAALKKNIIKKMRELDGDGLTAWEIDKIVKASDKPKTPSADDVISPYQKYFENRSELLNKVNELLSQYVDSLDEATE